jgi:NAD(P)-dependent dehydrogenase (short-subunit alcohol dehydrogenase family)
MSFKDKVVVVLGATGVVGTGVVRKYLDAGATVVGVSRSAGKLEDLKKRIDIKAAEPFLSVEGDFQDEAQASRTREAVVGALKGKTIDHVVSILGFPAVDKGPTETSLEAFRKSLDDGLFNTFLAAKVFLPGLKSREGSSYTIVSGGLAHFPPPNPVLWLGTVKNAAVNALNHALTSETAKDPVRVNTICIHFGIAPIGGNKNQFGMPTEGDGLRLAPAFLGVARGTTKGQVICLNNWAEAEKWSS